MSGKLNLDEGDERHFQHELTGYGTVVIGGDAESRKTEILKYMDEPVIVADGNNITSDRDLWVHIITSAYDDVSESDLESKRSLYINARRSLVDTDSGILIHEFDAMDSDVQTDIAQSFKGIAENMNFDQEIGFTATEGNPVVRAEFDLSMRVRTWELETDE